MGDGTIKKDSVPFTQISNSVLNDKALSFKAKGLFAFMFSKPDGWNFTIKSISSQGSDGNDSVKSALRELRDAGFLDYQKHDSGKGTYTLIINPKAENPNEGFPYKGKSTRISNKDLVSNKDLSKDNSGKVPRNKPREFKYPPSFETLWSTYTPQSQKGDKWQGFRAYCEALKSYPDEALLSAAKRENGKTFGQRHLSTILRSDIEDFLKQKITTTKKHKETIGGVIDSFFNKYVADNNDDINTTVEAVA